MADAGIKKNLINFVHKRQSLIFQLLIKMCFPDAFYHAVI